MRATFRIYIRHKVRDRVKYKFIAIYARFWVMPIAGF